MVMFTGLMTIEKEERLEKTSDYQEQDLSFEYMLFGLLLLAPFSMTVVLPFLKKDYLRREKIELNADTLYHKSNLSSWISKAYPLILLLQKIALAIIIFSFHDIVIQLCALVLTNLLFSWLIFAIPQIYLDKHLRRFELLNQGLLSLLTICLLLFTDHVYDRRLQHDFGYTFSLLIGIYATIGLFTASAYGLAEPAIRWYRLRALRLMQIRLAMELRATLIREARERKDARKNRRVDNFNAFTVDFGASLGDELRHTGRR